MSQLLDIDSEADAVENDTRTGYISRFQSEFEMLQHLGKGGNGVVFEVKNKKDGEKCAIKRIDLANQPSNLLERERKIRDCKHPNIVKYIDSWVEHAPPMWQENEDDKWKTQFNLIHLIPIALPYHDNEMGEASKHTEEAACMVSSIKPPEYLYIQMELCKKDNLADWLLKSDETDRQNQYIPIYSQIIKAVEYIHSRNIIHRDLKPENIMFGFDGRIRIGDFGTVTEHDIPTTSREKNSHVMHTVGVGTKWYKAPELEGGHYDYRVDIFSLGVILYELITPFGTDSERYDAIERLCNSPFPKDFNPKFEAEFDLLKKMLSRNPKKRPKLQTIEEYLARRDLESHELFVALLSAFTKFNLAQPNLLATQNMINLIEKKEKLVSKNRPQKRQKDNRMLQ